MSSLRDAAQAALEALESSRVFVTSREKIKHPEGTEWYDERIAALRAALAQQAEPVQDQRCRAEPRSDGDFVCDCKIGACPGRSAALAQQAEPLNLRDPAVQKRLATQWGYVPAAQAEPVEPVEPVAWMVYTEGGTSAYVTDNPTDLVGAYRALSLYTAPPQRTMVPLTEGEIDAEWHELDGEASALFKRVIRKFARGIEKASWEKNNG